MDKLLDVLAKVMPLLAFYPKAVQTLFLITFLLVLVSIAAFVILYGQASTKLRASELTGETAAEIRQELSSLSTVMTDLGSAISAYYASGVKLHVHLQEHIKESPKIKTYLDAPLTQGLKRDVEDLIKDVNGLEAALIAIQRNPFALACWRRAVTGAQWSATKHIQSSLVDRGFTVVEATIDISNIPSVVQYFSAARSRLSNLTFAPPINALLAANAANVPGTGVQYDHIALRSLMFSGNAILARTDQSKHAPHRTFIASWGTAILHDTYSAIPDLATIRNELADRYPKYSVAIRTNLTLNYQRPDVSQEFKFADDELEKRKSLVFFEMPQRTGK